MCEEDATTDEDTRPPVDPDCTGHPAWPWEEEGEEQEQHLEQEHNLEQERHLEQEQRGRTTNTMKLTDIIVDYLDVVEAIRNIPNGSSPGPDGVLPCLLKQGGTSIALMLTNIFQSSFDTGEIPDILKLGLICPIHKV